METILQSYQNLSEEDKRRAVPDRPVEHILPEGWVLHMNEQAFLTPEDWEQARKLELSASLDFWLDEEDLYD